MASGCAAPPPASETFAGAPVVIVAVDTLRSDRLPAYGYADVATPAIDALRADAVLFARAYAHAPLTLPSHASLFSGLLPPQHGVRDNGGYTFDAAVHPHLPSLLAAGGYDTAAFVSSQVLRREAGLAAGFAVYDAGEAEQRAGSATVAAAAAWLRARRGSGRPFLLFVHLYEPHAPYLPPEPFASRYRHDPYDGEVAAADAAVGTLLAELRADGSYERALVALLADHGEGLGDHGESGHGVLLYREVLQVPLLVKLPGGSRRGERVERPVGLIDVAPTVLALLGRSVPPVLQGRHLLPAPGAAEPAAASERTLYAETYYPRLHLGWSELTSLIAGPYHYLHGPQPELFDLTADPAERRDLRATERRTAAALREALAGQVVAPAAPSAVDAETAAELAALGYAARGRLADGELPDPRRRLASLAALESAKAEIARQQWAAAVEALARLVDAEPGMLDGWFTLAMCLEELGRPAETLHAYRRALELSGGEPAYAFAVARTLFRLGHLEEAARHAELALRGAPEDVRAHELLAAVALRSGRPGEARQRLERALAIDGARPAAWTTLGVALFQLAETDAADAAWRRALALDPRQPDALLNLGVTAARRGRREEARELLRRFLAGAPPARLAVEGVRVERLLRELDG